MNTDLILSLYVHYICTRAVRNGWLNYDPLVIFDTLGNYLRHGFVKTLS